MLNARYAVLSGAVAMVVLVPGSPVAQSQPSSETAFFIRTAASGGRAEVDLGSLAQQRAASQAVGSFGTTMVADHTRLNAELEDLAAQKNVDLARAPSPAHASHHARLAQLSADRFDRAYMDAMVADHEHDVAAFRKASESADRDVKAFATRTLAILEAHLREGERVRGTIGAAVRATDRNES